jgi:hypothetical protein
MKQFVSHLFLFVFLFVSACGGPPAAAQVETPAAPATSPVEDPCSPQNLPFTVQPINDLMREFEDASQMASNLPAQQLPQLIADLQRIRRGAEDVQIPDCLTTLKTHQLNHMNLMIQTLLAFVGGATQEELTSGLAMAREEHDLYSLEIIRLLGVTLAPITATPPSSQETQAVSTTP